MNNFVPPKANCIDLVCSESGLYERTKISGKRYLRKIWMPIMQTPFYLLGYIGGIFLAFCLSVFENNFIAGLGEVMLVLLLVVVPISLFFCSAVFASFPTNVQLDTEGLRFLWLSKTQKWTPTIPWASIRKLSADDQTELAKSGGKAVTVGLNIDLGWLPLINRLDLIWQTFALWKGAFFPVGAFIGAKTLALEFPLESLTLEADKFRMMSAIQTQVPSDAIDTEFTRLCDSSNTPTYTQLWLDDLRSFRRAKAGELIPDTMLQDGRYKIKSKIATGGQAKLYEAEDTQEHKLVALKELILPTNAGAEVRNRSFGNVKNEALMLAKLNHPQIVKLLDNFVEDHRSYLVMEYLEGRTLRKVVQQDGPIPSDNIQALAHQLLDILIYLHGQTPPIVHRDLTPDNLILPADGKLRLIDFNVAQLLESDNTKTVVGKHNYMAPEQFKGKPCAQSDLYSLGCTLYFCLTGKDPIPLSISRPSKVCAVPEKLDDFIATLTATDLSQRFASAASAIAELG